MSSTQEKIAIIGGGVSGIVSAFLLSQKYEVTLFEANSKLGGHTNTFIVQSGPDEGIAVDTGFIVLNDKTYPLMHKFLEKLKAPVRYSNMSFGFYCERSGLCYSGNGISGLFAQRKNFFRRSHWRFLGEIQKFCKQGLADLHDDRISSETLRQYSVRHGYSQRLIDDYVIPMAAAIWSARAVDILDFPMRTFLNFFYNHGLLSLNDRPKWQTVVGGSCSYVHAFERSFSGRIVTGNPISKIERINGKINVVCAGRSESFDKCVVATHADQALNLLGDPSDEEKTILGAWKYQKNYTVLHTDRNALPPIRRAIASWNYRRELTANGEEPLSVTYYMNLLQGLQSKNDYCVTLNSKGLIDESKILYEIEYQHPIYNLPAIQSQVLLNKIQGVRQTWYCGSYFGYGFHEDAVRSAVSICDKLGVSAL